MEDIEYKIIQKEKVADLHFPQEDILKSEMLKKERGTKINQAISLGNLEHQKVKIYFSDNTGKKKVETTIWAVTDSAIVLKQNIIIPIHRIHKLEI